jgi:hypothetical protein
VKNQTIIRDERYYAVEHASYRIGHIILTFGLFLLIFVRSILYHESYWDLFALVVVANLAATVYQVVHKILPWSWRWVYFFVAVFLAATIVTFVVGLLMK